LKSETDIAIIVGVDYNERIDMLVISRQKDESLMIGDDVEITIVDVRGDKVRLGINAPRNISVHRKEIYLAIQKEKAQGN
jgi:carbon storage regulator